MFQVCTACKKLMAICHILQYTQLINCYLENKYILGGIIIIIVGMHKAKQFF